MASFYGWRVHRFTLRFWFIDNFSSKKDFQIFRFWVHFLVEKNSKKSTFLRYKDESFDTFLHLLGDVTFVTVTLCCTVWQLNEYSKLLVSSLFAAAMSDSTFDLEKWLLHHPYFLAELTKYTFFVFRSFFDEKRPLIFRFSIKMNFRQI